MNTKTNATKTYLSLVITALALALFLVPTQVANADHEGGGYGYADTSGGYYFDTFTPNYYSNSYTPNYYSNTYTPSYSSYSSPSYKYSAPKSSYVAPTYKYNSSSGCSGCGYKSAPYQTYRTASTPSGGGSSYSSSPNYVYVSAANTNSNTNTNTNTSTATASNSNTITNTFNPTNTNNPNINVVVLGASTPTTPVNPPYYPPYNNQMSVSCYINPSNAYVNQNVTFTANATGGSGNYTYSWSGSDGLNGYGQTFTGMFSYAGTKYATVTVYSNGQSATATCNTNVQGNNYVNPIVGGTTVIRDTTVGTPVSGVFLNQVPATGIDAKNVKMILFVVGLFAWSLFAAYIVSIKRKTQLAGASNTGNIVARIEAFKAENMRKKGIVA